jgi:hypothetical protein
MMIEDFPSGRFVTMVYAELDPSTRVLRIANAGHLSPLLVEPSGHRWINHEHGLPLGISASKFSETEVTLGEDRASRFIPTESPRPSVSTAHASTDNVSGEEYGADRLLAQLQLARRFAGWPARGCQEICEWNRAARRRHCDPGETRPTESGSRANACRKAGFTSD